MRTKHVSSPSVVGDNGLVLMYADLWPQPYLKYRGGELDTPPHTHTSVVFEYLTQVDFPIQFPLLPTDWSHMLLRTFFGKKIQTKLSLFLFALFNFPGLLCNLCKNIVSRARFF